MVHALRKIQTLLKSDGVLINMQPVGEPRLIEVRDGGRRTKVGPVQHRLDFALHKAAQLAVEDTVAGGVFRMARAFTFPFHYHFPTFAELERWLHEEVENAVLPEEVAMLGHQLWERAGPGGTAVMRDEILVMRLEAS